MNALGRFDAATEGRGQGGTLPQGRHYPTTLQVPAFHLLIGTAGYSETAQAAPKSVHNGIAEDTPWLVVGSVRLWVAPFLF